jgi:sigma-B regulation protein RsbU (phosphoserine phosphatase)
MATGGHPPPLIQRADGRTTTVGLEGGSLLGVFTEPEFKSTRVRMDAGDTLVLFTDGVLEARRESVFFGVEGVERVLTDEAGSARAAASALEAAVLQHAGGSLSDDVAAIVLYVPDDL